MINSIEGNFKVQFFYNRLKIRTGYAYAACMYVHSLLGELLRIFYVSLVEQFFHI